MDKPLSDAEAALREAALDYHRTPTRGKISVTPTKPLSNQRDLSLAYSPGRGLCLPGDRGRPDAGRRVHLARQPGRRGHQRHRGAGPGRHRPAGRQAGDGRQGLPVQEVRRHRRVRHRARREATPTSWSRSSPRSSPRWAASTSRTSRRPSASTSRSKLRERMNIPVFHDDQHGTAIISSAALLNGLELVGKKIGDVKLAVSGAGAAAIACLDVMVGLGVKRENIFVVDSQGRDPRRPRRFQERQARREQAALLPEDRGAHAGRRGQGRRRLPRLLGRRRAVGRDGRRRWPPSRSSWRWPTPSPRSGPNWPRRRGPTASSPPGAPTTRTRSTTSCAFPYIFRGALDCGATKITEAMKLACVREIAALAKAEISDEVAAAYAGQELKLRARLHHPQALRRRG